MRPRTIVKGALVRLRLDGGGLSSWVGRVFRLDIRRGMPIVEASGAQQRHEGPPERFVIVEDDGR